MIFTSLFLSAAALLQVNQAPLKSPGTLAACSYTEFEPISYGEGKGYEPAMLQAIAKLWGVRLEVYSEPVFDGLWHLPSRKYTLCDVANGGISPSAEREKQGAAFSQKTAQFSQSLLVRKKDFTSGNITSYSSFKAGQYKIGVVPGTTGEIYAHELAKRYGIPETVFVQYAGESLLLPALLKGEIDAIGRGEIGNEYQASLNNQLITIAKHDFGEGFSFAVDSKNSALLSQLNLAIQELTKNGKLGYREWLADPEMFMKRVNEIRKKNSL